MKKIISIALILMASSVIATEKTNRPNPKVLWQLNQQESDLRKAKGELFLRNRQIKDSTKRLTDLSNKYSDLVSSHRELQGQYQILWYQNQQLINSIKKGGNLTPEIAKRIKKMNGRLPASTPKKK